MLPWYQANVLWGRGKLLYHINRTQGHEWGECCMIGEECVRDPYTGQQGLWMAYLTAQIAFMMSHLKYQFPLVLIPFKGDLYVWEFDHRSVLQVLRETLTALLRWTMKIWVYLSTTWPKSHKHLICLHFSYFTFSFYSQNKLEKFKKQTGLGTGMEIAM